MRDELGLRAEKRFQKSAGQSCVLPVTLKVFNPLLLVRNVLLATQYVAWRSACVEDAWTDPSCTPRIGGSAIDLSATGAYGRSLAGDAEQ